MPNNTTESPKLSIAAEEIHQTIRDLLTQVDTLATDVDNCERKAKERESAQSKPDVVQHVGAAATVTAKAGSQTVQSTTAEPKEQDYVQTETEKEKDGKAETEIREPDTHTSDDDRAGQGIKDDGMDKKEGDTDTGYKVHKDPDRGGNRITIDPLPPIDQPRQSHGGKRKPQHDTSDNTKGQQKKPHIKRQPDPQADPDDEERMGNRRKPNKAKKQMQQPVRRPEPVKIEKIILTSETLTVKDLSEKIGKPVVEIIKKLMQLGVLASINQEIDCETAELICSEFDIEVEVQMAKSAEETLADLADVEDDESQLVPRPPVITIMGHVDHGKTSLLDAIRHSNVTEGEAGGITQHIGAYQVTCNGKLITFIDTPGHEAFTSMRARGAQVTDIVILVVAADDGIMPQTIEAINHSKAAGVPIIVAVNKIDKDGANPERIKMQLTEHDLVVEDYGGDVICVPISAKKKINIDGLLEMVLLQADIMDIKANPNRLARGTIIEAELHKGKGPVATVLVQNGTLKIGDPIVAGMAYGKVRAMMDDKGRKVTKAGPGTPVQVLGFNEVPTGGDVLYVSDADKLSRQVAEERRDRMKAEQVKAASKVSLNDLFSQIAEGKVKELNIIVKADTQGTVEAVKQSLEKLSTPEVRVKCIHGGVGAVTTNDVMFATASNAIIIGFNVRPDATARAAAEKENVDVRLYRVIYQAIEDVEKAMQGLFDPEYKEVALGTIEVRSTFKVSGVGTIAGAYVRDGKVQRSAEVRVVRDGIVIHEGKISSLKRFKDDAKEVAQGFECGIGIADFNDIQEGDIIEAFVMEEIKRT